MQCLAHSHTAEVIEVGTLLGSPSEPGSLGSWQAGRFLASHCSSRALASPSPMEWCHHWSPESSLTGVMLGK